MARAPTSQQTWSAPPVTPRGLGSHRVSRQLNGRAPRSRCCRWALTDCAAHPEARCVATQATHSVGSPVAPHFGFSLQTLRSGLGTALVSLAWGGPASACVYVTLFCPPPHNPHNLLRLHTGRAALAVRRLPHRRRPATQRKRTQHYVRRSYSHHAWEEGLPPTRALRRRAWLYTQPQEERDHRSRL